MDLFSPRSLKVGEESSEKENMLMVDGIIVLMKPPEKILLTVKSERPKNESKDLITYKTIQDKVEFKTSLLLDIITSSH